jgi:hypothetical protein
LSEAQLKPQEVFFTGTVTGVDTEEYEFTHWNE